MIKITKKLIGKHPRPSDNSGDCLIESVDGYYSNGYWAIKTRSAIVGKNIKFSEKRPDVEKSIDLPNSTEVLTFSRFVTIGAENDGKKFVSKNGRSTMLLSAFYCEKLGIGNEVKTKASRPDSIGFVHTPAICGDVILMPLRPARL